MNGFPNFKEFYQKALIPVGEHDQQLLLQSRKEKNESDTITTHWLIALEGDVIKKGSEMYHWKVVVYPSTLNGAITCKKPFFISPFFKTMYEAIDFSREIERQATADILTTNQLNVNII